MTAGSEVAAFVTEGAAAARRHTDQVLVIPDKGGPRWGASVLVAGPSGTLAVTCEHVVRRHARVFVGPHQLARATVEEGAPGVGAATVLGSSRTYDLAVVQPDPGHALRSRCEAITNLDLRAVTHGMLAKNLRLAGLLSAAPAKFTQGTQYPDGLIYTESPLYTVCGPIVHVSDDIIVVDVAEAEILLKNVKSFPGLASVNATGGVRDLRGISGSGLWVKIDGRFVLAGIVLGPNPGSGDQHLVRATPVWKVTDFLNLE